MKQLRKPAVELLHGNWPGEVVVGADSLGWDIDLKLTLHCSPLTLHNFCVQLSLVCDSKGQKGDCKTCARRLSCGKSGKESGAH